jgi:hypothetical protein
MSHYSYNQLIISQGLRPHPRTSVWRVAVATCFVEVDVVDTGTDLFIFLEMYNELLIDI